MSSTEIVHGSNNDNDTPQSGFSGGNNDHPASYAVQAQVQSAPGAMSAGVADSSGTGTDDKRFTTSYGMVVWPTLPGLSSSTSPSSAPAPAPGTQMTCSAPADLVHHHSPSEATAAPTTAQTLLPVTMATMASHANDVVNGGGGPLQYSTSSTLLLRAACDACHRMKRKCDGKHPCARCERRGRDCLYSYKQKSGPPKGSKRKLIEEEDDLPENRPSKPSLRYHLDGVANSPGDGSFPATATVGAVQPTVTAAPVVATWPGSNRSSSNKGSNLPEYSGSGDARDSGSDYVNHHASSSSTPIETAQQYTQVPAQQFVEMPAQQPMPPHTQQCSPRPAPASAPAPAPPSPLRPSPEARAAAAAAVAASRMNALAPVPPTLATAGLHAQYMLQPPPATLPGLSGGGGGGVAVGQGAAASLATHPQYGTVYHHQYPPEVYAVYLAELRQRSSGHSGTIGSNIGSSISSSSNGSISNSSDTTNNVPSTSNSIASTSSPATAAAAITPTPAVSAPQEGTSSLATAEAVEAVQTAPDTPAVGPQAGTVAASGTPIATTKPNTTTAWSPPLAAAIPAGHLLPGIGGDWTEGKGSAGTTNSGSGGGAEQDAAAPAPVAKTPDQGDGGGDSGSYCAGKAVAAASSAALAAAVAAAIARTSPTVDGESSKKIIDAALATCSVAPPDGGRGSSDLCTPLPPVRSNNFSVAVPDGSGGRAGEISPKMAGAQAVLTVAPAVASAAAPAPASGSTQRERNELAAAGLLLYGARGQGGTAGSSNGGAVGSGKVEEGEENYFSQQQQQQQQQNSSLTT